MECRCAAADTLASLSMTLALLTGSVPSCLLGPELAFSVDREGASTQSEREDHQGLVNREISSTSDIVIWGNLEFTCSGLIGNQKINLPEFFTTQLLPGIPKIS